MLDSKIPVWLAFFMVGLYFTASSAVFGWTCISIGAVWFIPRMHVRWQKTA